MPRPRPRRYADQVPLAVKAPAEDGPAFLMKQVKGVSSTLTRRQVTGQDFLGRQDNHGGFSLCHCDHDRTIADIRSRKEHHARATPEREWEQTGEPGA